MSVETIEQIEADRRRMAEEYQQDLAFFHIFRTVVNGKVATDCQANRHLITAWLQEDQGEVLSPELFKKILAEQPQLANQLSWQSPEKLDKKKTEAAREPENRRVFNDAAQRLRFSKCEANYRLLTSLDEVLDFYRIQSLVNLGTDGSSRLSLAPPTQEELAQWTREEQEGRADYLINHASPDELRRAAQSEFQKKRLEAQQAEAERQIAGREAADAAFGFPPLPETNQHGEKIDAAYLTKISNTNLQLFRALIRKNGAANVTARLRGIR